MVMDTAQGILSTAEQLTLFQKDNIHTAYMIDNGHTKRDNTCGI
jgi:hypothetical protein